MTISNKGVHLDSGFYSDHDLLKMVVKIKEKKSPTVDYPWLFSEYDNILQIVSEASGVSALTILGKSRSRPVVMARFIATVLCYDLEHSSTWTTVADYFGSAANVAQKRYKQAMEQLTRDEGFETLFNRCALAWVNSPALG